MYSFIIKFFLILFLFLSGVNAETIKNIEINGNKRISKETIIVLSGISLNSDFKDFNLNDSLKKLYETEFFSDINF